MKNLRDAFLNSRTRFCFLMLIAVFSTLAALPRLSTATAPPLTLTIKVVNNSGWEIRHLYLSPVSNDNWGSDQLSAYISPGATQSLNVSWDQSTVKLVAEDQDGCFLSTTVDATGSPVWTITSDANRDCGG